MTTRFDPIDASVLVLIMVLILIARFGDWRGSRPPGSRN
jgi:hypothetical protein